MGHLGLHEGRSVVGTSEVFERKMMSGMLQYLGAIDTERYSVLKATTEEP